MDNARDFRRSRFIIFCYFCDVVYFDNAKIIELIMRKIFITLLFMILSFTLFPQKQGYKFSIKLIGVDAPILYVKGNYGHQSYIFDSIKANSQSLYLLQNKKRIIPDGLYELVDKKGNSYLEFIVSQNRNFSIKTDTNKWLNYSVEGSDENRFFAMIKQMEDYNVLDRETVLQYVELSPESLLSKYLKAQYLFTELPDYYIDNNNEIIDLDIAYSYLIDHFFDHIDFGDARLLRTPINHNLDLFFTEILSNQHSDTINREIDKLISKMKGNDEVRRYYLQYLYRLFDTGFPEHAAILVHLYDTYCPNERCDWLDEHFNRRIKRETLRKRKILTGQIVPPLEVYTHSQERISSEDIKNQYIVLWFWDPDCEDCVEKTPKLYEFYQDFHEVYDFEVIAISITEDYERWNKLIPKFPNWINASFAVGKPNYDFVDYFDLLTTPGIFIIDKEHKIIARQFPLEEIFTIFEH